MFMQTKEEWIGFAIVMTIAYIPYWVYVRKINSAFKQWKLRKRDENIL